MRVMITGATGFIGESLSQYAAALGCSVLGLDVQNPSDTWSQAGLRYEHCDVRDSSRLKALIEAFRPDRVFHLAAQSFPTVSMVKPRETMETNVCGTINLYEALHQTGMRPTVVVACSSAEYGPVPIEDVPVKETHALNPVHPYGVSKVGQDLLAAQYFATHGIPSIRIRLFNTTGPGKRGDVCSDLARRAIEIELGLQPPLLKVGNVDKRRAIADSRDVVRGFWLAAEHCTPGDVYNLGADRVYSVMDVIDLIRANVKTPFELEPDPVIMRACDEPVIAGDIGKFQKCAGWKPEIELASTIRDMLNWWRNRLGETSRPLAATSVAAGAAAGEQR